MVSREAAAHDLPPSSRWLVTYHPFLLAALYADVYVPDTHTHNLSLTHTDVKEYLAVHSTAAAGGGGAGAKGKGKALKKKGVTLPLEMFQDVGFRVSVCVGGGTGRLVRSC